jgi:phosphoribosylglycinamide formyltransferase-1
MVKSPLRLGVLISGRGSNLQAILDAIHEGRLTHTEVALVVSNRPSAQGLLMAAERGVAIQAFSIKAFDSRSAMDAAMVEALKAAGVDWIILAGYDRVLTDAFLHAFEGRILNIHPSLLPKFGGIGMVGMKVHEAVISAGEPESGCTVHGVTAVVDGGPIYGQARVAVSPDDTPETLAQKVLAEEHRLYPAVIQRLADEHFTVGEALHAPSSC